MKYLILFIYLVTQFDLTFGQCLCDNQPTYKKTALIIGQNKYTKLNPLDNSENDATDMSNYLKKNGFVVFDVGMSAPASVMKGIIYRWFETLGEYDVALFYYSGHGFEYKGSEYIVPIDLDKPIGNAFTQLDIDYSCVSIDKILSEMDDHNVSVKIVILDACRSYATSSKSAIGNSSVAKMIGPKGSFIGFAASPGNTADGGDKSDRNSWYTSALLDILKKKPKSTLDEIFNLVNKAVREKSLGTQIPYKNSSLDREFCLNYFQQHPKSVFSEEDSQKNSYITNVDSIFSDDVIKLNTTYESTHIADRIKYEALQNAVECKGDSIKYFWQYLSKSNIGIRAYSYFNNHGLHDKITNDSYIVYEFKKGILVKINIRIYPTVERKLFYAALGQDTSTHAENYVCNTQDVYYTSGTSFSNSGMVEVTICTKEGFISCSNDWWNNLTSENQVSNIK